MARRVDLLTPAIDAWRSDESERHTATSWSAIDVGFLAIMSSGLVFLAVAIIALTVGQPPATALRVAAIVAAITLVCLNVVATALYLGVAGRLFDHWLLANLERRRIDALYLVERERIHTQHLAEMERLRLTGEVRALTDRALIARAGQVEETLPLPDPLRDLAARLICEAYQHHDAQGWIDSGVISRRRVMSEQFSQSQYEELAARLEEAGIMTFDRARQRWRLNTARFADAQEATMALVGAWR